MRCVRSEFVRRPRSDRCCIATVLHSHCTLSKGDREIRGALVPQCRVLFVFVFGSSSVDISTMISTTTRSYSIDAWWIIAQRPVPWQRCFQYRISRENVGCIKALGADGIGCGARWGVYGFQSLVLSRPNRMYRHMSW
jgi:hypothetical protein